MSCFAALALLGSLFVAAADVESAPRKAEIRYELTHDPSAACWRVRMTARGIDARAGAVSLVLEDWGEWTTVDAYYLRELESRPSARVDPSRRSRPEERTPITARS